MSKNVMNKAAATRAGTIPLLSDPESFVMVVCGVIAIDPAFLRGTGFERSHVTSGSSTLKQQNTLVTTQCKQH